MKKHIIYSFIYLCFEQGGFPLQDNTKIYNNKQRCSVVCNDLSGFKKKKKGVENLEDHAHAHTVLLLFFSFSFFKHKKAHLHFQFSPGLIHQSRITYLRLISLPVNGIVSSARAGWSRDCGTTARGSSRREEQCGKFIIVSRPQKPRTVKTPGCSHARLHIPASLLRPCHLKQES